MHKHVVSRRTKRRNAALRSINPFHNRAARRRLVHLGFEIRMVHFPAVPGVMLNVARTPCLARHCAHESTKKSPGHSCTSKYNLPSLVYSASLRAWDVEPLSRPSSFAAFLSVRCSSWTLPLDTCVPAVLTIFLKVDAHDATMRLFAGEVDAAAADSRNNPEPSMGGSCLSPPMSLSSSLSVGNSDRWRTPGVVARWRAMSDAQQVTRLRS